MQQVHTDGRLIAGETRVETLLPCWNCLPSDVFSNVLTHFGDDLPQRCIWSIRLTCRYWRALAADHIVALSTSGISWQQPALHHVSRMLQHFQHVTLIHQLPLKYISALPASLSCSLVTLTLTGSGSTTLCEQCLSCLKMLQSCTFYGPVTMTDTLYKVLGCLPKLEHLAFFTLLLARKPYQQSSFDKNIFQQLKCLEIVRQAPVASNGLCMCSGQAGEQFLLSMPQLLRIRLDVCSLRRVMLEVLDRMPVLKFVEVTGTPESACTLELLQQWSQRSGVHLLCLDPNRNVWSPYYSRWFATAPVSTAQWQLRGKRS